MLIRFQNAVIKNVSSIVGQTNLTTNMVVANPLFYLITSANYWRRIRQHKLGHALCHIYIVESMYPSFGASVYQARILWWKSKEKTYSNRLQYLIGTLF